MRSEKKIKITVGSLEMEALLNESKTAQAIWESLPIKSSTNLWGDEVYFEIPVKLGPENPREVVEEGDLAYWPQGRGFCIFFGPTPASGGDEIRPASAVNIIGRVLGNPKEFKKVRDGEEILIDKS